MLAALALAAAAPMAHADPITVEQLFEIQNAANTQCLVDNGGRSRIPCRCAAVLVSEQVILQGIDAVKGTYDKVFNNAFEQCRTHEDRAFPMRAARLYQSRAAAEEMLAGGAVK